MGRPRHLLSDQPIVFLAGALASSDQRCKTSVFRLVAGLFAVELGGQHSIVLLGSHPSGALLELGPLGGNVRLRVVHVGCQDGCSSAVALGIVGKVIAYRPVGRSRRCS